MALPQVGHITWSACEVDGADADMPLWGWVQSNILDAGSMLEESPSREIVMGEGVRPTAVVRCEMTRWCCCGGVGSSSVSDVSTFISLSSLELLVLVELAMSRVVALPFVEEG